jgi:hypothetical protein
METITPKPPKIPGKKKNKVLRPSQIIKKERQYIVLDGQLGKSIGMLERGTKIYITGKSFSGKSSAIIMLCAAISKHMKVDYNNHEEKGGDAATVKKKMHHAGIDETFDDSIRFYQAPLISDTHETFAEILNKKSSAGFAVLDSVQHAGMGKADYIAFTNKFCNPKKGKIVAFINHWIKNDLTKHILHDCDVKLESMNYVINVESRLEGATNQPIIIWEEGAKKAWGKNYNKVIKGQYWPGKKK